MSARRRLGRLGLAGSAALALGVVAAGPAAAASAFDQSDTADVTLQDTTGAPFTCRLYWDQFGYTDGTAYARAMIPSGDARCTTRNSSIRISSTWVDGDGDTRTGASQAYGSWTVVQSLDGVERGLRTTYTFYFEACGCSVQQSFTQPK